MKVTLKNGTIYHHALSLTYKEGGKVEFVYHDKIKVDNPNKEYPDRYHFILKTAELDITDLASVSDYSHDPK